jgi:hypothetical protein
MRIGSIATTDAPRIWSLGIGLRLDVNWKSSRQPNTKELTSVWLQR